MRCISFQYHLSHFYYIGSLYSRRNYDLFAQGLCMLVALYVHQVNLISHIRDKIRLTIFEYSNSICLFGI